MPTSNDIAAAIAKTLASPGKGTASASVKSSGAASSSIQASIDKTLAKLQATPGAGQANAVVNQPHHESWWQKALNVVAVPQRVIASAANELGQGINAAFTPGHDPNDPRFHASWGDFVKNIGNYDGKHRGIGVGDIIEQAHPNLNPWVKRGLGLAGDIATDPITYLGGEDQLAKLGRIGTASKIAEAGNAAHETAVLAEAAGHTAEAAAHTARGDRLLADAANVGAKGVAHSSTEGLNAIGAHGGVMFNVPGTGRIARGIRGAVGMAPGELQQLQLISRESGTGRGLSAIAKGLDSVLARGKKIGVVANVLDKIGGEEAKASYRKAIASGDAEHIYAATKGLHAENLKGVAEQQSEQLLGNKLRDVLIPAKKAGIAGEDLSHAAQGSAEAMAKVSAASPEVAARIRPFFDDAVAHLNEVAGREVLKPVENYGPRHLTDQAAQLLGIGEHGGADFARSSGTAAFEKARELKPGAEFLGTKLVSAAEHPLGLTIEQQATDILRKAVEDGKVQGAQKAMLEHGISGDAHMFNPNAYESWPRYVRAMSKRAGGAARESYLRDAGVWADKGHFVPVLEEAKAKLQAAKDLAGSTKADAATKAAAVEEARQAVVKAHEVLNGANVAAEAHIAGAQEAVRQTAEKLQLPVHEAQALRSYADEHFGAPLEVLQHEKTQITQDISTHQTTLTDSYKGLDAAATQYRSALAKQEFLDGEIRRIQGGMEQAASAGPRYQATEAKLTHLEQLREGVSQSITQHTANVHQAIEISRANEERLIELVRTAPGKMDAIDFKEQFLRQQADETYKAAAGYEAQVRAAQVSDTKAAIADGQNAATKVMVLHQIAQGHVAEAEAMLGDVKRLGKMAGTRAQKAETAMNQLEAHIRNLAEQIDKNPKLAERFIETYRGGMHPIGFNGVADPVVIDAMAAGAKAVMPHDVGALLKQYDKMTNLWKAYALATPGFHFRVGFGHMWNNMLAGVEMGGYRRFLSARKAYQEGRLAELSPKEAAAITAWIERGPNWGRQTAYDVDKNLLSTTSLSPFSREFAPLKFNQKMGEKGQELLRGALGYDRLVKGDSIEEAIAQVYKFHFDYSDISQFERNVIRRVIPFYTWTRKTLPLQIEQLIHQPGKFAHFMQLKNEVEAETPAPGFVPNYFLDQMSIRTPFQNGGGNVYVDPHLPFQDLTKFNSLSDIVSNANPIIKVPTELIAGKQFFTGQPFTGKYAAIPGTWQKIPGFTQIAAHLGYAKKGADGSWMMTDRDLYKVENSLPIFGQMRRLLPSETKYQQRAVTSFLSFALGMGIRSNTTADQKNAALQQLFQLQQISKEQKSLGYLQTSADRQKQALAEALSATGQTG